MIFRYPDYYCRSVRTTGLWYVGVGALLFLLFITNLFKSIPLLYLATFFFSLYAFVEGIPRLIRGYKYELIGYELDYYGLKILHPEGIKILVRWRDIKKLTKTEKYLTIGIPFGQEEISRELGNFDEFMETIQSHKVKEKRDMRETRIKFLKPSPVPAASTVKAKTGESAKDFSRTKPPGAETPHPTKRVSEDDDDAAPRETLIITGDNKTLQKAMERHQSRKQVAETMIIPPALSPAGVPLVEEHTYLESKPAETPIVPPSPAKEHKTPEIKAAETAVIPPAALKRAMDRHLPGGQAEGDLSQQKKIKPETFLGLYSKVMDSERKKEGAPGRAPGSPGIPAHLPPLKSMKPSSYKEALQKQLDEIPTVDAMIKHFAATLKRLAEK